MRQLATQLLKDKDKLHAKYNELQREVEGMGENDPSTLMKSRLMMAEEERDQLQEQVYGLQAEVERLKKEFKKEVHGEGVVGGMQEEGGGGNTPKIMERGEEGEENKGQGVFGKVGKNGRRNTLVQSSADDQKPSYRDYMDSSDVLIDHHRA